jgi:hypothetical protein
LFSYQIVELIWTDQDIQIEGLDKYKDLLQSAILVPEHYGLSEHKKTFDEHYCVERRAMGIKDTKLTINDNHAWIHVIECCNMEDLKLDVDCHAVYKTEWLRVPCDPGGWRCLHLAIYKKWVLDNEKLLEDQAVHGSVSDRMEAILLLPRCWLSFSASGVSCGNNIDDEVGSELKDVSRREGCQEPANGP